MMTDKEIKKAAIAIIYNRKAYKLNKFNSLHEVNQAVNAYMGAGCLAVDQVKTCNAVIELLGYEVI